MSEDGNHAINDEIGYAGFMYWIVAREDGAVVAIPKPGQHSAAKKEKHRMAAVEQWHQEQANVAR